MDKYYEIYSQSISELQNIKKRLSEEHIEIENILNRECDIKFANSPSNLDIYDYLFAVFFGVAGATISSSKQIEGFLDQIHKHASGDKRNSNSVQSVIGNLLTHQGDAMDIPMGSSNFINRQGDNSYGLFHRLFWGHDILSTNSDNPILLMIKSDGLLIGIIQVFRHLIADTFSKQGLPLPGSSYLDYIRDDEKLSNALLNIVQEFATQNGNKSMAQEYYRHMFTIRAQDVMAQGLVYAAAKGYFKFRGIKDQTRQRQYKVLSYSVNFITHALIGTIRQSGIPYVSWPALTMVIKELGGLFIDSKREINRLSKITDQLIKENSKLINRGNIVEKKVFNTGKSIITRESPIEYIQNYLDEEKSSMDLIDFLEED